MKFAEWNCPGALCALYMNNRVQNGKGHTHIGGMSGNAFITCSQNGIHPVISVYCTATRSGYAFIAGEVIIIKIGTTGTLHEVTTCSSHIPQLRRSPG